MAFTCGFFDSLSGDRKYNAKQISEIFDGVIRDGVYASIGTRFLVEPGTGMQITINTGRAWFNHTWTLNDAKFPLTIELADLILDRIDAVVLEVDSSLEIRNNQFKVVKGTPSSNPQKPKMTNTESIHQYALAYVRVKKNVTSITTSDIEINVGKTDCPFVTSILEAADISSLYSQWESQFRDWENEQKTGFEEWLVAKKNGFDTWFDEMKGQLSEDAAGNLQLQMDEKGIQIYTHSKEGTVHKFVGNGPNGRALMTDNVAAGDTFQVNGSPVTAYMGADNAVDVMAGSAYIGKWVSFIAEDGILNFKGGGGGKVTVSGLSAAAIKTGTTVTIKQGEKNIQTVTGTFTSDANATAPLILMGYTAYVNGQKVAGSMPYYNQKTFTPANYDQYLYPGYFLNGLQTIKGDPNLVAGNIKKGVSIFGVIGTMQPSPQPGSFTAYSGDSVNTGMVGYLQGSWLLNTTYHFIGALDYSGTYVGWFSLRLDMTTYRSIAVRKWGGNWAGNRGTYRFGVARTTNQGEFVTYIDVPGTGESNNNIVYTLNIAGVNELCYIKFESVDGGAAHGFNEIVLSI